MSYDAASNLSLEADYQYIGWSSYKQLAIQFKADPSRNETQPKNYSDTYIIRFGAEYSVDAWQLRAGYLYDHSPVSDQYVDPMLPDANRNGVTAGIGYTFSRNWKIDAAYFFLKFDQRKVQNTIIGFDGTYNSTANLIGVNVGYMF